MKKIWITAGVACALTLTGCGGGGTPAPKADAGATPAASSGAATPDMENGATITGKVSFDGKAPVMKTLDMSAVPACTAAHKTPAKSEEVVVDDKGDVKNAFVWIKSGLPADKTWQVPTSAVQITQEGCMYTPHVLALMAGQNLDIKNGDPTNHNIHPMPANNPEFNQSQPPGAGDIDHSFARQEVMVPVKCNIHPWMRAYIGVVNHPFFAVTGDDGTYSIKGLPPGTYTIEMWQEKYGTQDQQITVGAKDSKTQDFTIKG
ncbi:MAG TPA: carboxypeptidase regulatory-like domain-containing protein [Bryobacteraceae bacterium]|jgi:plastocyanin|nr:carboxypeptidase regulatory-like domain-containing protein [Bryobacteraceae bacterium]